MSNILAERGHVEIKEEEDNSRDSGFSSGRASPDPNNAEKFTNVRLDDCARGADSDQLDMFCEFGFENTRVEERVYKTQVTHRIPLADCTNTSYSSQSSNRSFTTNSRSMKQWIDSPLTTVCTQPEPRLLSFSMFDSNSDISFCDHSQRFTVLDENDGCGTRSQPLRRTMSEHKDRPQRKRSIETRAEMENKRKKSSPSNVEDLDIDFDESVFTVDDDCSPNLSTWSLASQQRSLPRATSCGVLEMGEHHSSPNLPKIMEVVYSLPTVTKPQTDSQAFKSISAATLANELRKLGEKEFSERFTLVDCRYPYEYLGGHIKTAVNIHDQNELESIFFPVDSSASIRKRIPIFYCEYSQKRGPGMAHRLRSLDRSRNELHYPLVDYKEIYLLDHGYRRFFSEQTQQDLCEPINYVTMREPQHSKQLTAYKWHKSKSSHHLDRQERATGGSDRFISRRRALFTRHLSMGTLNEDTTPCTSRTRSMASESSLNDSEGGSIAQRLNFEMDSPDNSCSE